MATTSLAIEINKLINSLKKQSKGQYAVLSFFFGQSQGQYAVLSFFSIKKRIVKRLVRGTIIFFGQSQGQYAVLSFFSIKKRIVKRLVRGTIIFWGNQKVSTRYYHFFFSEISCDVGLSLFFSYFCKASKFSNCLSRQPSTSLSSQP